MEPASSNDEHNRHVDARENNLIAYNTQVRHGFEVISEEWMSQLAEGYYTYFADKRHETLGRPHDGSSIDGGDWRVTDRQRTITAAIVLCLNLGVDPPDIIKTHPAARLEGWVDPQQYADSKKALEQIGKNVQAQYEGMSARTKIKQSLDPTIDDIKRFCVSLRRATRDDRILFHYNGHGVPRPTPSGEIWVFNRGYTQYIPLSVYELQTWLGTPVIYCYDCSGAGNILKSFNDFVQKRKQLQAEEQRNLSNNVPEGSPMSASTRSSGSFVPNGYPSTAAPNSSGVNATAYESCIQLGACGADEILPMNPDLPADLFTCCITTPIETAVKWFLLQNTRGFTSSGQDPHNVQIPGKITDRRTPLGELNWIFTAITDTIAWSMLDSALFRRLFRQDLIVAAMFRNFLLAKRIMIAHNCHPVSTPELPDTSGHSLWDSWDAAINHCLLQVATPTPSSDIRLFSDFFEQQLTAFDMWLNYQSSDVDHAPEQLPIVLQVLLSQIHRLRALGLLSRYLDLGPKAVRIALSIGFFIYVIKLLQSPAPELRPVLVFIWARVMAVHRPFQTDLIKDQCYTYFVNILIESADGNTPLQHSRNGSVDSNAASTVTPTSTVSSVNSLSGLEKAAQDKEKKGDTAMCCFILAQFAHEYPNAQHVLSSNEELLSVVEQYSDAESPLLRQWAILLLAELVPLRSISHILWHLKDPIPEVRAAVLYTFSAYLFSERLSDEDADLVGKAVVSVALDGSPVVRYELLVFLSHFIKRNESKFLVCAYTTLEEEFAASRHGGDMRSKSPAHGTVSLALWRCLMVLTDDAMIHVKSAAENLVDQIHLKLMRTPLSEEVNRMANALLEPSELRNIDLGSHNEERSIPRILNNAHRSCQNDIDGTLHGYYDNSNYPEVGSPAETRNSSSFAKTFIDSALNWIIGSDAADNNKSQINQVSKLSTRRSMASLVPSQSHQRLAGSDVSSTVTPSHTIAESATPVKEPSVPNHNSFASHPIQSQNNSSSHVSLVAEQSNMPVTVHTDKDLILKSEFREFCVEYFREPLLRPIEGDEAGSKLYYEKNWRKTRNEKIMADTQAQKGLSVTGSWGNQTSNLEGVGEPAKKMVFAQFEPHIICADSNDIVVFDWQKGGKLLNRIHGGRILSDVQFLNEDDVPLVLTASRDGIARVFKNYEDPNACHLVTSWWLFADLVHHQSNNPLVLVDWQQSRGHLLVGGDARVVRIWDAAREQPISDMPVRTSAQLSALTSDKVAGNLVFAGFNDGAIHLYDRRMDKQQSLVKRWKPRSSGLHSKPQTHGSKILNLRMQRGGPREVASGSADGLVCLWDIRSSTPVNNFQAHTKEMRCMDIHEHAPVIATASRVAGIWSTSGRRISTLKGPSASLLSSKVSPVGSIVFHPHQMVLAMSNAEEPAVNVFHCTP